MHRSWARPGYHGNCMYVVYPPAPPPALCRKAAEELDCSLFVHPWDMQTDGRMAKYWLPWLVGEYLGALDT